MSAEEFTLVRWLLEHGKTGAAAFLAQLDRARVVSRCACGCASIDFDIDGKSPPIAAGLEILSDYVWTSECGAKFGVFVFAKGGILAGLEVWSIDGEATADKLPQIESLKPIVFG